MRFGLFGSASARRGGAEFDSSEGFRDFIEYNVEAEALGFHSTFVVEHHFTGYGQVSATLNLLTWVGARTRRLRLGTAVMVLPWHNPMLLAEQAATLDLLSGGRLDFGIGKGYRYNEFAGFRMSMEEADARFEECLEVLLKAWTADEPFSRCLPTDGKQGVLMRNGYKVYDSDTHIGPSADTLEKYLSSRVRELLPDLERRKVTTKRHSAGVAYDSPYPTRFRLGSGGAVGGWGADVPRTLGEAEPRATTGGASGRFMGSKAPNLFSDDWDADGRIRDMDEEGVDVQLLVNNGGPSGHENREVNIEFMRAQHRFLDDFCGRYPHRLKSMICANASYIEDSVAEIKRWSGSPWAVGVYVSLPVDYPLDHPGLHPIWQAIDEAGLCFIHHSFSQGYPGYRDLWHNPFLGRSASHPWGAMRAMGAFFGAGLMDRYANLRFAVLESGFGWIPFWTARIEDQAHYMGFVAEGLQHTMLEYTTSGRFFASIVLHEGGKMVKLVSEYLGDHLLMFSSDYPHAETRFPGSVDLALSWQEVNPDLMRKILWDNAVKAFGEP